MKKILLLILILVSINSLAQFPNNQGFGTATTQTNINGGLKAWHGIINGIYTDTTAANADYIDWYKGSQIYAGGHFWIRDSLPMRWSRMMRYSEIPSYTANLPIRITGTVFSIDTSYAYDPALITHKRLRQVIDSMIAAGAFGNQKFGHPSGDFSLGEDRYVNGHSNYNLWFDSLFSYTSNSDATQLQSLNGTVRYNHNVNSTNIISPDGLNSVLVSNNRTWFGLNDATDSLGSTVLPYNSSVRLVALAQDSVTGRWYRKTASGSTPTLQQVTDVGSITTNTVQINNASASQTLIAINSGSGTTIFGSNTGSGQIGNYELTHSSTNTVRTMFDYNRFTTGTAANGLGQKHRYVLQAADGSSYVAMSLNVLWDDATAKTARTVFNTMNAGSEINTLGLYGTGQIEFPAYTGSNFNTAQAKVAMVGTDGKIYAVDTTGVFQGGGSGGSDGGIHSVTGQSGIINVNDSTVRADTSYAHAGSIVSNDRAKQIVDSLKSAGWGAQTVNYQPWYQYYVGLTAPSSTEYIQKAVSGTGSAIVSMNSTSIPDGWMFAFKNSLGTTTTGSCYYYTFAASGYAAISISNSFRYNYGTKLRLDDLSDGTETYTLHCGFIDDVNSLAAITDGVCFRYSHADSSGKWIMHTESNNTVTEVATSTTVAADTDYELEISVIGGTAYFYINKVLAGTISTNIPTGSTRITSIGLLFLKSAGTTNRDLFIEYMAFGRRNN